MIALLRRFIRNTHGGLAPAYAGFITMMLGGAAISVDYSTLVREDSRLQIAVDTATSAAAEHLPDTAAATSEARRILAINLPSGTYGDLAARATVEFGVWENNSFTAQTGEDKAVRVAARWDNSVSQALPTTFGSVLGVVALQPFAEAVGIPSAGAVCMLGLGPGSGTVGLKIGGGDTAFASNCEVHIHASEPAQALEIGSGGSLQSLRTCVVGGVKGAGGASPPAEAGCDEPREDPLSGYSPAISTACTEPLLTIAGTVETIYPGVYCGGMEINGAATVTFSPGIYVIKDGPFKISSTSTVSGNGVTFYFTGMTTKIQITADSPAHFTAPTSGPTAGILFLEGPNLEPQAKVKISSGVNAYYDGLTYMPTQHIEFAGGGVHPSPPEFSAYIAYSFELKSSYVFMRLNTRQTVLPVPDGLKGRRFNLVM
jgi:hypothetical protein